jgi:hypothetical protein
LVPLEDLLNVWRGVSVRNVLVVVTVRPWPDAVAVTV